MRPSAAPVTKTKNIEVNKAHIFRKMSTPMVTPTVQHGHCLNVQNDVCHISIGMILPPYPGLTVFHYLEETAGSTKQSWHETRRPSVIVNKTIVRNDPEKEQTLRTIAPPPCRGNVQNTKSWNLILFHPVRHPHLRPTPPTRRIQLVNVQHGDYKRTVWGDDGMLFNYDCIAIPGEIANSTEKLW